MATQGTYRLGGTRRRVAGLARGEGLELDFAAALTVNTLDAGSPATRMSRPTRWRAARGSPVPSSGTRAATGSRRSARALVIVADPAAEAIGVYRSCGFAGGRSQLTFERPPAEPD